MLSYRLGKVNDFHWEFKPVLSYSKSHIFSTFFGEEKENKSRDDNVGLGVGFHNIPFIFPSHFYGFFRHKLAEVTSSRSGVSLSQYRTVPISNAVISPFSSRENLCHNTEILPNLVGFEFFTFNFCSVKWQSEWMCMFEIGLIMDEKTNSKDKEKKKNLFILLSLQS